MSQKAIWGHFGQPFPSQGGHAEKKSQLGSCLDKRGRVTIDFSRDRSHGKPGKKSSGGGVPIRVPIRDDDDADDDELPANPPRPCKTGKHPKTPADEWHFATGGSR